MQEMGKLRLDRENMHVSIESIFSISQEKHQLKLHKFKFIGTQ